jgi:transcription elongation factor Elf1
MTKGFNCETCGKYHAFPMYVFAHMRDLLLITCDKCGAKHEVVMADAKQVTAGNPAMKGAEA